MSRKRKVETITKVATNQECQNHRQAMSQLKRIKWDIDFKNKNQENFYDSINSNTITFCIGPAGCGKTFIASYWALQHLADKNSNYDGIVVTKPMVEVDGEKLGYLPGNIDEKTEPFMQSVYYNMEQLIGTLVKTPLMGRQILYSTTPLLIEYSFTKRRIIIIWITGRHEVKTNMFNPVLWYLMSVHMMFLALFLGPILEPRMLTING